jgi:RNA polymerase sigma factor (sigma-70 family)
MIEVLHSFFRELRLVRWYGRLKTRCLRGNTDLPETGYLQGWVVMDTPASNPDGLAALQSLFEEAYPRLLAFARCRSTRGLAARRDPEDILQLAFLKARTRWADFPATGLAFYPWFCRIILDRLFDDHDYHASQKRDYRAETAWPDRSSEQMALGLQAPLTSPSESLMRKELKTRIDQVLAQLSPAHQEIMVLIHFGELTKEQAAEILRIKPGTARQQYARARAQFRLLWKKCFGSEEFA